MHSYTHNVNLQPFNIFKKRWEPMIQKPKFAFCVLVLFCLPWHMIVIVVYVVISKQILNHRI